MAMQYPELGKTGVKAPSYWLWLYGVSTNKSTHTDLHRGHLDIHTFVRVIP
jgi:hypothetical protein